MGILIFTIFAIIVFALLRQSVLLDPILGHSNNVVISKELNDPVVWKINLSMDVDGVFCRGRMPMINDSSLGAAHCLALQ